MRPGRLLTLPVNFHPSGTPGILAVDLAPMDLRQPGALVGEPVARLSSDTTSGQDGVEYSLSY